VRRLKDWRNEAVPPPQRRPDVIDPEPVWVTRLGSSLRAVRGKPYDWVGETMRPRNLHFRQRDIAP